MLYRITKTVVRSSTALGDQVEIPTVGWRTIFESPEAAATWLERDVQSWEKVWGRPIIKNDFCKVIRLVDEDNCKILIRRLIRKSSDDIGIVVFRIVEC